MAATDTRKALGIVYCPRCKEDTMPHEFTGKCLWCDKQLAEPKARE